MSDAEAAIAARAGDLIERPPRRAWRRVIVAAGLAGVLVLAGWGLQQVPGAHALAAYVLSLEAWTSTHPMLAILLLAAAVYVSGATAMPFGGMITAAGGFLLGGVAAGATAVVAAPLGALTLFLIVRRSFGDRLRSRLAARFAPFLRGFQSDAASYLISLRLMPTPFWLVNISAAVLGARWSTFWWTTAIGIVPMTFAHGFAGAAIGDVVRAHHNAAEACAAGDAARCASQLTFTGLIGPSTLLAFAALGVLALLPVLIRKLKFRGLRVGR